MAEHATVVAIDELERQRKYVHQLKEQNFDFGLTVGAAFIRGIRDLGYKGTDTALDELADNSISAGANRIALLFGPKGSDKPNAIAMADNGHGMDPEMIRLAVIWGGTHRENDRSGFGRYGYGLPSASVSIARRFTVFSRVIGGEWHAVEMDLDKIAAGDYTIEHRIVVPEAKAAKLPRWVADAIVAEFGASLDHGTIVLLEDLDRIFPKTVHALVGRLTAHFGMVYRNFLREVTMTVNGAPVEPVDPLFTTPGARHYDLDEDRAIPLPPQTIEVKDTRGAGGKITVRYAWLPPTFARVPEDKYRERGSNNERFGIMKATNGIIVLRNGRQIDVLNAKVPFTSFQNDDRYIKVEIDFPATLDEEFKITTSKQQIDLTERMWEILQKEGVPAAISSMRGKWEEARAALRVKREENAEAENARRASEQAMLDAEKFKNRAPTGEPVERAQKAEDRFQQEVDKRSSESGIKREMVESELRVDMTQNPYKVAQRSLPGAPFFDIEQVGGQRILYLNTAHAFYTDVYAAPDSTPRLRSALEVLLFVLGESELDASGDRRVFYQAERSQWSNRLTVVLDRLGQIDVAVEPNLDEVDAAVAAR
jgi:Histidine kinase-, DNA gyrase B-, and HSP90-like ATPase